jgi:hypothetical protein
VHARQPCSCMRCALILCRADHPTSARVWRRHTGAIYRACGQACTTSCAQRGACMPGDLRR